MENGENMDENTSKRPNPVKLGDKVRIGKVWYTIGFSSAFDFNKALMRYKDRSDIPDDELISLTDATGYPYEFKLSIVWDAVLAQQAKK